MAQKALIVNGMVRLSHWREAKNHVWPFKYFSAAELASKGNGSLMISEDALRRLDQLRSDLGAPMLITSAYRDPEHNRRVGGARHSLHMQGIAFDVRMENHDPVKFEAAARKVGFTGFGFYPHLGFMHIDTGPAREWGKRFPERKTRFAPEPVPAKYTQGAKEGTSVAAIAVAGERIVQEAAPLLSDELVTYGFTAFAVIGLGLVVYRIFRSRGE